MNLHTLHWAISLFLTFASINLASAVDTTLPSKIGMIVYPSFQAIDVFGPLDALNMLSWEQQLNLSLIASTLDPVSTKARSAGMNKFNSSFGESILPTHTFASAPGDLEVLFVPGGIGSRSPDQNETVAYIRHVFPSLRYLITVCTGAHLAARAGVLDGRNATSNKASWAATKLYPDVNWIAQARWVDDGKVWTSSGVSAGIDVTFAWIAAVYGESVADHLALGMEYVRQLDPSSDPFADHYNLTTSRKRC